MTPTDVRAALLRQGYSPLPLNGKAPTLKGWQQKFETNAAEIDLWRTAWPNAGNTGILCRFTPCLDIDILNADAAAAVEALVRERFEEAGDVLTRIGKPPKRAIPFRTQEPFAKITVPLIAPNGDTAQKLEFLGDGQQVVVDGIHPDTSKPYAWFGKSMLDVPHDELPCISAAEAQQLIDDAAELLVAEHGYKRADRRKKKGIGGDPGTGDPADWARLSANLINGHELHDSAVSLAASYIARGISADNALRMLRALMLASAIPHDERWQARFDDLGRIVRDAVEKFDKPPEPTPRERLLQSSAQFVAGFVPPDYLIDGILQRRFLYALTGKTGSGKTALALLLAACVALGRALGNLRVRKGRVIYLCGENPDDVRMRWIGLATEMQFATDAIEVYFIPGRFKISEMLDRVAKEVAECGEGALVVVDTSAAYFEGDEVSNTQQAEHARRLRKLVALPGGPCVLVLCHPVKNAAADNLLPLGAGAFLNEIDGNLTSSPSESKCQIWSTSMICCLTTGTQSAQFRGGESMIRFLAAILFSTLVMQMPVNAQQPATPSATDYVLVTVVLRHDQSRNLEEITTLDSGPSFRQKALRWSLGTLQWDWAT
jgi:hypothetical protein